MAGFQVITIGRFWVIAEDQYHWYMLWGLFGKRKQKIDGVSILVLQKRLDRLSTERLNVAMQKAWRRTYDKQWFYAVSIFDGDGAVLKMDKLYITMRHFDRRVEGEKLGDEELPDWALHSAYSSVEYNCPGGIAPGEARDKLYGFLALLCAELLGENSPGIFFTEERVALQNSPQLRKRLRSAESLNPRAVAKEMVLS